jgi:hypothetical protein
MGERMALGRDVLSLLDWTCVPSEVSDDRKAYEAAVKEWEDYMTSMSSRHDRGLSSPASDRDLWGPDGTDRMSRTIRVFCAWKGGEHAE